MIVCLCEGVSSSDLERAVREGACSVRELARATGAGTHCGSCACDLRALLRDHRDRARPGEGQDRAARAQGRVAAG